MDWDKYAAQIISDIEGVDCDFMDFVEGLRTIEQAIRERRVLAEDEIRVRDDEGDEGDEL